MKKEYLLPLHVHVCANESVAILMDLKHDTYLGFDQSQVSALQSLVRGWPASNSDDGQIDEDALAFANHLVQRNLLTLDRSQGKDFRPLALEAVEVSLVDKYSDDKGRFGLRDIGNFLLAWTHAKSSLASGTLERTIERMDKRRRHATCALDPGHTERLRQLIVDFHYLRSFVYTARNKCLLDSLVMIEFLARYGVFPTFVIGVKPKPFAAHAWVQQGRFLLNGETGFVRSFTPIVAA